ncbi:MAG TPA: formate--tetrahydrofolate ligase [Candidatus Izemoplasmatales bacterium]|nr:formate--tetrahydrofolate ligase [Candidatus Izemoplasmatales bacterium]
MKNITLNHPRKLRKITTIAATLGLKPADLELYGDYKAKIKMSAVQSPRFSRQGKIILVTAITPTSAGEGKTTTTIGLGDALRRLGVASAVCLREPSLGPVMGIKGGATGGGKAMVEPMEDINLHFTGDIHAVTSANNLISAVIDNHLFQGNPLRIDPERIVWKRCMDMNDRALREIEVGLSNPKEVRRKDRFDISVASEIMAILCLSRDLNDLKGRLEKVIVAYDTNGKPVTAGDLHVAGAATMLLKEAIQPNLVQTLENTPVLIHGGPFANIAHGCNSVIATDFARRAADFVVTESGFGADLGMEKFMDIKTRVLGVMPSAVVLVVSLKALRLHGGAPKEDTKTENLAALKKGMENLEKHMENIRYFHLPFVIALNKFATDSPEEISFLKEWAEERHAALEISDVYASGGAGAEGLARRVIVLASAEPDPLCGPLYDLQKSIPEKIETIAKRLYGASNVIFSEQAESQLREYAEAGWDRLPVCMAKTPLSLSDNPKLLGRPRDFTLTIREFKPSIGAGFLVALTGEVMTMPGLPKNGAFEKMDVVDGEIGGLF